MISDPVAKSPSRVQLIISAKSSGLSGFTSKFAAAPETKQRFTEALGHAAEEVFEMMVGIPLGAAEQVTGPSSADYTAMIGLAGDLCGVLSFRCSSRSATQIAGKMLGTDETASAESIRDALGEICNMVAGSFKAQISDLAGQCLLSVPTVVSGSDYQLYPLAEGMRIQVAKSLEGALIAMTLDLHGG